MLQTALSWVFWVTLIYVVTIPLLILVYWSQIRNDLELGKLVGGFTSHVFHLAFVLCLISGLWWISLALGGK